MCISLDSTALNSDISAFHTRTHCRQTMMENCTTKNKRKTSNKFRRAPSIEEGCAYLHIHTIGIRIDETYVSQCGYIIRRYLHTYVDTCEKISCQEQWALLREILNRHFRDLGKNTFEYNIKDVIAYNRRLQRNVPEPINIHPCFLVLLLIILIFMFYWDIQLFVYTVGAFILTVYWENR